MSFNMLLNNSLLITNFLLLHSAKYLCVFNIDICHNKLVIKYNLKIYIFSIQCLYKVLSMLPH